MRNVEDLKKKEWVIAWSGGKDSTATILKCIELGIPIKEIRYRRLMWNENVSAVIPEIDHFILDTAERLKNEYGLNVVIEESHRYVKDMVDRVYKKGIKKGEIHNFTSNNFKYCVFQMLKTFTPAKVKKERGEEHTLVGWCYDEKKRYKPSENKDSLLYVLGLTQKDAMSICEQYNMVNPIYRLGFKRDGCFFCHNASDIEIEYLKNHHTDLYNMVVNRYKLSMETLKRHNINTTQYNKIKWFDYEEVK